MSEQQAPAPWEQESAERTSKIQAVLDDMRLPVDSVFVPWSQSRNKDEKHRSLNWMVTLRRDGRPILTTDYMAGSGHCPSYKQRGMTADDQARILFEYERGLPTRRVMFGTAIAKPHAQPILPDPLDVIHSLILDSSVLDYPTYEEWAGEFGYGEDSRKGERTYHACLKIALQLRAEIGEQGLARLREAFEGC